MTFWITLREISKLRYRNQTNILSYPVPIFYKNKYPNPILIQKNCKHPAGYPILILSMLTSSSGAEVTGVNFSDSDSAPKFLNPAPDPAILQIWESDACSNSATIIDPTVIYPCFYLRYDRTDSCYCRNGEVTPDPGPFFHKFLTPGPDPGPKKNAESCWSQLRHSGYGPTSALKQCCADFAIQ